MDAMPVVTSLGICSEYLEVHLQPGVQLGRCADFNDLRGVATRLLDLRDRSRHPLHRCHHQAFYGETTDDAR
jgi:hypothetical protein